MKKLFLMAVVIVALAAPAAHARYAGGLHVSARAAVVMDADTGAVVISKNMREKLPPASTAKVMTAVLAIEGARLTDWYRVSRHAAGREPTKVNLRTGDLVTVEALLYALLLKSANDAATVIAEGMAGSEQAFTAMMTERARELGATDTVFKTASGLPAKGQYTTAYDLALIMRHALTLPKFVEVASAKYATLNMGKSEKELKNSNKLLWIYDGAVAGKTGYTRAARDCYVGSVDCGGRRLVVSVLKSERRWDDVTKLLDAGFGLAEGGEMLVLDGAGRLVDPDAQAVVQRPETDMVTEGAE